VQAKLPKTDQILQGDTLTFAAPTADGAMRVLQTDIRASRFSGGTLKVTSQVPFTVLLDDREVITKESVHATTLSANFNRFDPPAPGARNRLHPDGETPHVCHRLRGSQLQRLLHPRREV